MGQLNASGRRPSELMALDIDSPGIDGLFGMRSIKPEGYVGATGDDTLDLLGFDVEKTDAGLRFWLVNLRPPVDANGIYLDAKKVGANVTIDVFDMKRRSDKMVHVKTVWDPAIWSPNKVAALGDGSFVVTNDASASGQYNTPKKIQELTLPQSAFEKNLISSLVAAMWCTVLIQALAILRLTPRCSLPMVWYVVLTGSFTFLFR